MRNKNQPIIDRIRDKLDEYENRYFGMSNMRENSGVFLNPNTFADLQECISGWSNLSGDPVEVYGFQVFEDHFIPEDMIKVLPLSIDDLRVEDRLMRFPPLHYLEQMVHESMRTRPIAKFGERDESITQAIIGFEVLSDHYYPYWSNIREYNIDPIHDFGIEYKFDTEATPHNPAQLANLHRLNKYELKRGDAPVEFLAINFKDPISYDSHDFDELSQMFAEYIHDKINSSIEQPLLQDGYKYEYTNHNPELLSEMNEKHLKKREVQDVKIGVLIKKLGRVWIKTGDHIQQEFYRRYNNYNSSSTGGMFYDN